MPFTVSHTIAVLPILRVNKLSMTGLFVGSMVPDFEYFIRMNLYGIHGHTFSGILYFDLPLGVALCFIYHLLVRDFFIGIAPGFISGRLTRYKNFDWMKYFKSNFLWVLISILIGAITHVLWDSFTHGGGYMVNEFPFLRKRIPVFDTSFPIFYIFQHVSTVAGLFIIGRWFMNLPVEKRTGSGNAKIIMVFVVLAMVLFTIRIYFMHLSREIKIGHVIVVLISAMFYSSILSSLIWKRLKKVFN